LEMIAKYGADATRFGLLLMSSAQDVRFSEEKIGMGRNFANKLWNASRLVLLASEGVETQRGDADQVDRWITSRFQRCVAGVEAAVTVFDFTAAVDTVYHFVWDEFCDWYLELVKVRLYGENAAQKAQAAGHSRWILDQIVRLLHPFLPFVTAEVAQQYSAAPLIDQSHPRYDEALLAPADEAAIGELQAVVDALRRFRAEADVPPGKVLEAVFVGEDGTAAAGVASAALGAARAAAGGSGTGAARYAPFAAAFRALARTEVSFAGEPAADATVVLVPGGRLEVAAAVDKAEEIFRLEQQLAKAEAEVARGEAKLANEGFTSRAPEAVVVKERDKLAAHASERDEVAARLAQLRAG
ncbi:MAG TPA: class I tRNA ligase family protein, partial [Thermoleophilia bacterium]|nr:class I tRNA ligase family protein [Thermoleophilia bacterium]